jgi:hypothetical protein
MMVMVIEVTTSEDKVLQLRKEEREKQNGLKAKVYLIGPFCFTTRV